MMNFDEIARFALDNIIWTMLASAAAGGLIWSFTRNSSRLVDCADAVLMVKRDKGIFIDTRSLADFSGGRIAQARHIPADEIDKRANEIDRYRDKPVILVCQNGMNSRQRARVLTDAGFAAVHVMRGGMNAWTEAQLPLLKK